MSCTNLRCTNWRSHSQSHFGVGIRDPIARRRHQDPQIGLSSKSCCHLSCTTLHCTTLSCLSCANSLGFGIRLLHGAFPLRSPSLRYDFVASWQVFATLYCLPQGRRCLCTTHANSSAAFSSRRHSRRRGTVARGCHCSLRLRLDLVRYC